MLDTGEEPRARRIWLVISEDTWSSFSEIISPSSSICAPVKPEEEDEARGAESEDLIVLCRPVEPEAVGFVGLCLTILKQGQK